MDDNRALKISENLENTESYQTLIPILGKKGGAIPPSALVTRIISCTDGADWPVTLEAMQALIRRLASVVHDELLIACKPKGGVILGGYTIRRKGSSEARPYYTIVSDVETIRGSCDCPDYIRNSLGLCKHMLTVIQDIYSKPRNLKKAIAERRFAEGCKVSSIAWEPVKPFCGVGDWLAQVSWVCFDKELKKPLTRGVLKKWFEIDKNGMANLKETYFFDPSKRFELVKDLIKVTKFAYTAHLKNGEHYDPALRALLLSEKKQLSFLFSNAVGSKQLKSSLQGLKRELYPFQEEGVRRFVQNGRLLIADDMGLGKTAQAIGCCSILWQLGKVKRGLLIVPASLKSQWLREWQMFSDAPVSVVDGSPAQRREIYRNSRKGFVIANYEQLFRDIEDIHAWKADVVVLDEAQRIKNWATKTAHYAKLLKPPYRLVLTGTPMENRINELASIVEWVDDFALEPKWRLAPWHSIYVDGSKEISGARNLDTLRARIKPVFIRRTRQEVLKQLPSRTDTRVPIPMTLEQFEAHESLASPIAQLMNISKKRPLRQGEFLRLMQLLTTQRIISNGLAQFQFEEIWPTISLGDKPTEAMMNSLSSPKLIEFRELVRQIVVEQGRKVVVFSQWRRMLKLAQWAIQDIMAECSLRAAFFTGREKQKRRTQNIVEFHDTPDLRVLFASDAGGVGLNLQRAANCVINLELPWNPAVLEQRIGRIYRIGQKLPIDVYNLVSEVGIESRIAGIVGSKQAFFTGLFDGATDEVIFEQSGSFMSDIQKLIEPVEVPELSQNLRDDEVLDIEGECAQDEEVDRILATADETEDVSDAVDQAPRLENVAQNQSHGKQPSHLEVSTLLSQLEIRKGNDGNVVINAPVEAAKTLGAIFEGMASLLRNVGG